LIFRGFRISVQRIEGLLAGQGRYTLVRGESSIR